MSNLHNNIDRIAAAFSDIKDAIEKQGGTVTECTPPEAYGDAIRALQPSIGGGGSCKCDLTPYAKTVDVDAKDASTLAAAKTYADNILRSDPGSSVTTAYVDERDRATLTEAKNYTDSKVAGVIGDATKAAENKVKEMIDESGGGATYAYVDEHDAATLASALAADAEVLDEAKEYADSIQPDVIDTIDKNSNALVTSRAIANALDTKQPALTGSTELFTLQQGDNPRIHVHYLDDITIDAGGNATIIQGEIYLVLTNDTKFMGVGSDGIYDGNAFTFVTGVQMKYGGENMTIKNVTWTSSNPKITGVWNKNNSTITWTVPDKTDLNQTADIKVTATGTNSIFGTANEKTAEGVVQVVGVKSAEDGVSYDLDLNYGYVLGRLQSDGKTYKYTPNGADAPLLAKAYKDLGGTRTPIGGGDYRITYGFDAATPIAATSYNDATKTYELAIGTPSSDNKFLHVYLYENNVMWDHETLAIVRDGQKGEDAESTTELVIINDTKYIGTGDDYTYNGNPLQFESEVYLQYGGERLSPTGTGLTIASASGVSANTTWNDTTKSWKVVWTVQNKTNLKNSITIKLSAIGKTANNLVTKSADGIVQIVGVKGAKDGVSYEVCPNYGFVIGSPKDDDSGYNYAPDRIECTVYYTEGTTRRPATDTDLKIRYKVDTSSGWSSIIPVISGGASFTLADGTILPTSKFVTIELWKTASPNDVLWDTEVLAIVRDGVKGRPGDAGTSINLTMNFTAESITASDANILEKYNLQNGVTTYPVTSGYTGTRGDYLVVLHNANGTTTDKYEHAAVYKKTDNEWVRYPGNETLQVGLAGVAPGSGHIIMWDGSQWVDVGNIRGGYIHQKFADEALTDTEKEYPSAKKITYLPGQPILYFTRENGVYTELTAGEYPGKYIGILVDDNPIAAAPLDAYKWTRWSGEDGYGMEQIFMLGTSDKAPEKPVRSNYFDAETNLKWYNYDFEPTVKSTVYPPSIHWEDAPLAPTITENCCWMSYRLLSVDTKREWSIPRPYLYFAEDGEPATAVHIHNDNITLLLDHTDGRTTIVENTESCRIDFYVGSERKNVTNIKLDDGVTKVQLNDLNNGGEFTLTVDKNIDVSDINRLQINFTYDGNPYSGYVGVTKLLSDRNYNITCTPSTIHQDGNDGSLDNLVDKNGNIVVENSAPYGIRFTITKETAKGGITEITNTAKANHPDYAIYYKCKNDAGLTEFTEASNWIQVTNKLNPITYVEIRSKEDTGYVYNDSETIDFIKDGTDGMDSTLQEFVYYQKLSSDTAEPEIIYGLKGSGNKQKMIYDEVKNTASYQSDDFLPYVTTGSGATKWLDQAPDLMPQNTIWYAWRVKEAAKAGTGKWGEFKGPKKWAVYGENGRDGDGVEYVFCLTKGETAPGLSQTVGNSTLKPENTSEWLPKIDNNTNSYALGKGEYWSDDPLNVTKAYPIQWVSKRKYGYKAGSTTEKEWSDFTAPTKWSVYADTATTAQMGNDILPIGTGSDYKLDTDIKDVTNYITLSTGSTACTGLKLLNVNLNGSSHELTGNKQTNPGTITETITNETIGDGQIKLTFTSIGNNDTNIGFKLDIKSPLMLDQPYIIEFKVSGVSDGQEYNGTATFTIVGIPGAEDGVFYSVNIEPNDFYIGFNESTDDIPANITVVKTIGPNHESVDISNLQTSGDECMYYYTDTDPILRKITNPININELNSANGLPTVLTVVYKNGLFIDSESAFIHREVKSIDYMQEMYAIQSKGTDVVGNYEANGDLDPDYWRESWVDAIAAYDFLQPDDETKLGDLTRLDDLDLELWNVMKIAYTDGSVSYTDFTNFGNGIRNIVELYQVTNPGVIINDTNIAAYKPIATVTKSAPQASIDALVAAGWSKAKPDSTAKFDCLWNVEIVVCEDNTCKATDVALINQMVYGESPYSLLIENQYPGVPADANGKVETANNANIFTSKATLMNGSDAITNNVTFAVAPYKIVVKETTGSNQERSFYCTGEDSDGYKYEVSDKSLYMHVARNTAYDTNPTIKNNRFYKADGSAPDGYTLNVLGTYKLTTSAITAEGSVFISSTSTYEQSIDDCYTFVQATYGEMKITDCIGVHRVKKGVPGIPYLYCGEWQPDTEYYSNEQRIDLVKVTVGDDATYYICQEPHDYTTYNHKSGDTFNPDLNKGWWQKFEGNYKSIATELLLAETGYIENLRVKMEQVDDLYVNQLYVRDDADASKNWITVDDIEVGQDDINKQYRYLDPVHWNTGNFHINTTGGLNSSNKLRFSLPVSAGVTSITLPNITVTGIWKHPQKDAIWITNTAVLRDSTGNTLATAPVRVYRDYECTDQLEPATGSHAPDANVPADVTYYQFYNTGNGRTRYVKIVFPPMKIQTADYNANEIYIEFKVGTCVAISGGSANYSFTATMDGYVLFAGTAKNTGVVIGKNGFTITNGDPRGQNGINVNTATVFINENGEMASQGFVLSNEINKIVVVSSIGQVGSEPGVLYLLQEP